MGKSVDETKKFSLWMILLSVVGLIASAYLVQDHYNTNASGCDIGSTFSCSIVNKSSFSTLHNVPVAWLGVTWFATLVVMCVKIFKYGGDVQYWITLEMFWTLLGLLFVLYFVVGEIVVGAICPVCTLVHGIVVCCLVLSWKHFQVYRSALTESPRTMLLQTLAATGRYVIVFVVLHLFLFGVHNVKASPEVIDSTSESVTQEGQSTQDQLISLVSCLRENDVMFYGSSRCSHCRYQMQLFGDQVGNVHFVDCIQKENTNVCAIKNIRVYPTWIHGKQEKEHQGVLSLKDLAKFAGCNEVEQ